MNQSKLLSLNFLLLVQKYPTVFPTPISVMGSVIGQFPFMQRGFISDYILYIMILHISSGTTLEVEGGGALALPELGVQKREQKEKQTIYVLLIKHGL
jgi:hypothetical protein